MSDKHFCFRALASTPAEMAFREADKKLNKFNSICYLYLQIAFMAF